MGKGRQFRRTEARLKQSGTSLPRQPLLPRKVLFMNDVSVSKMSSAPVSGQEHWTNKGDVKLFLWEKFVGNPANTAGTVLFVHGSSMASQPTFDLHVPGRPDSSAMDWFAQRGFNCWCVDMEGYGRSEKTRDNNAPISQGADDCLAAATYIQKLRGKRPFLVYGISSGALRAALFAERNPQLIARLALDAMVWTGEGSPTLAERKRSCRNSKARTGGRSIAPSFARFSTATIREPPRIASSKPLPTQSWRSTIPSRPELMSTCARACLSSTPPKSPCQL